MQPDHHDPMTRCISVYSCSDARYNRATVHCDHVIMIMLAVRQPQVSFETPNLVLNITVNIDIDGSTAGSYQLQLAALRRGHSEEANLPIGQRGTYPEAAAAAAAAEEPPGEGDDPEAAALPAAAVSQI